MPIIGIRGAEARQTKVDMMMAVILAGGRGKRLSPITADRPKPMAEVLGKPIIDWNVEWLSSTSSIDSVLLLAGYRADVLLAHMERNHNGLAYKIVEEKEPLGTGGALLNARDYLRDEKEFFVVMGDTITNISLDGLSPLGKNVASIALVPLRSEKGVVKSRGSRVTEFREKPVIPGQWMNTGEYLVSNRIFGYLRHKCSTESDVFPKLAEEGLIKGVKFADSYFRPIDSIKDLEEAEVELGGKS